MIIFSTKMNPFLFTAGIRIISFLHVFVQGNDKEALIFDRFSSSLFNLPDNIPQDAKCGAWAVACPAESAKDMEFISEYSFTNNALFVREVHHRDSKASEVRKKVCEESVKLSLTFHIRSSTFQFGFEIYYKLSDAQYFHDNNYDDYKSLEETVPNLKSVAAKGLFVAREYKRIGQNAFGTNIKELWFNKDRKMGFVWINLVKFVFDSPNRIVRKMTYHISTNSRWPIEGEQCEDFSLGNEVYRDFQVDPLYSQIKKNIFDHLKLTWTKTKACGSNSECFKKILLIPMDQFRFGNSPLLCSNLATIPVWKDTLAEHFLKKVDQYLYAIYKVKNEPLQIITGLSGEHEYSKKIGWSKSTIYLNSEKKKIPIPKVIYRMVEYRVKNCKLEETLCWYSAIIVIHNDPFFKTSDKICSRDVTKDWGWDEIIPHSLPPESKTLSDMVYVCPKERDVVRKLFGLRKAYTGPAKAPGLSLKNFPFSMDGKNIDGEDIVEKVDDKLDKLHSGEENFSHEGGEIMELRENIYNLEDEGLLADDGKSFTK